MKVTKYLHSCLLVEDSNKKLLIDPGLFVFVDNLVRVEAMPRVDVIAYTHIHGDHFDVEILHKLLRKSPDAQILANEEVAQVLLKDNIQVHTLSAGQTVELAGFSIQGVSGPHESIEPDEASDNIGVFINDRLLHPGDSQHANVESCEILALPSVAPWTRRTEVWKYARSLKPRHIIPIHDGFLKDYFRNANDQKISSWVKEWGCEYHALKPGESMEVQ